MIAGIGNDLVEIKRFESMVENEGFLRRNFTREEIIEGNSRQSTKIAYFAANFSVKESVAKVFGTGISGFTLDEIEVLRKENGQPYVTLHGKAKEVADSLGIKQILISISDTKELVMTVAVGEK